jgi:hypothetical protein
MMKLTLFLIVVINFTSVFSMELKKLIKDEYFEKVKIFGEQDARVLLNNIKNDNVDVYTFNSKITFPNKFQFHWGKILRPTLSKEQVTKIANLNGRTYCKGEESFTKNKITIVLSDVAPFSTLIHEYLHVLQIRKNPIWCEVSRKIKKKQVSEEDIKTSEALEEEVVQILFENRGIVAFSFKDMAKISEGAKKQIELKKYLDLYKNESSKIDVSLNDDDLLKCHQLEMKVFENELGEKCNCDKALKKDQRCLARLKRILNSITRK